MDVLLLFMVFATICPLFFAKRGMWTLSLLQGALMLGMWDYFLSHFTSMTLLNAPTSIIAFYGSLLLADIALIMFLIRFFKEIDTKKLPSFRSDLRSETE
ncbi:hypothetical protein SAMN05192534_11571 [Alteribacillus persepolensis]|uniref:Uncharacterized protein n=1 Tax=Alteribacillus persepolensis TaxID=568899 RepID=A0A1G8GFH1_9BACI|nr:hypothetical protein [Alteribacillus persepolensis]SDH93123.1 hypothetical protein SAMN05192534_11571 [Alteribacillus persepolensis]